MKPKEAVFLGVIAGAAAVGLLAARAEEERPGRDAVHAAISRAAPSIVRLEVRGSRPRGDAARARLFRDVEGRDAGAAIVVGERLVLTHASLIAYEDAALTVTTGDGRRLGAALKVRDGPRELALLETDAPLGVPALPLGASAGLPTGTLVLALGDPFGAAKDARPAASLGVLEGRLRLRAGAVTFRGEVLVTDAALNPGSEGGPLLDLSGKAIGVLAPLARDERSGSMVGYAIPIEAARPLLGGAPPPPPPPAKLGFRAVPGPDGLRVVEVEANGRAARAGLRTGDLLLEPATAEALRAAAEGELRLRVRRGPSEPGEAVELELVLEAGR